MENSGKNKEGGLREWQRGSFELEREEKGLWEGKGEGHCEMLKNLTIDGV